jgi:hypothetical protein
MYEKLRYVNHLNSYFETDGVELFVRMSDLRDYNWDYSMFGNRLTSFSRSAVERKVPFVMVCKTDSHEADSLKNIFFDFMEYDVKSQKPGRLYVGNWYAEGYVIGSKKSNYLINARYIEMELTFLDLAGFWRRETNYLISTFDTSAADTSTGLDFPFDFKFDFSAGNKLPTSSINIEYACNFKLWFYGPAVDPYLEIGDRKIGVTGTLKSGEIVKVDSAEKKITKINVNKEEENWIRYRTLNGESVFEAIPYGTHKLNCPGSYQIVLQTYEERSEPKFGTNLPDGNGVLVSDSGVVTVKQEVS